MNKKFSTLMLGMLLTSAFASADNINTSNVKVVDEWKSGKSYFVVADGNTEGVYDKNKDLFLSVSKVGDVYSFSGVKNGVDVKYLSWTFTQVTVSGANYYALKNEEYGVYLSFDAEGNVEASTKVDDAYLTAEAWNAATNKFDQGDKLYSVKAVGTSENGLAIATNAVSLEVGGSASSILLCEYSENVLADEDAVAALNDVKGGAGFNLKFSAGNTDPWANDILTDVNLKAFYVAEDITVNGNYAIPAGVYFATEYPASLASKAVIATSAEFEACTFVAVDPDKNYNINEAATEGVGFEFMTVKGSEMNLYSVDDDTENVSTGSEVYVGNACLTVIEPDPLRAAGEYRFKFDKVRHLKDLKKTEQMSTNDLYVGFVADRNENFLITVNDTKGTVLAFTTTNSTLYDVKKLLKSEDTPSIYSMQFVSEVNKEADGKYNEYGQYLTVGSNGLSSVVNFKSEDPMFQFVVAEVDTTNRSVTFVNRQKTSVKFEVSLYENEDGSFTVYPASGSSSLYVESFNDAEDEKVEFGGKILQNTKVVLTPVTVEDKFATFVNRAEGAGLVTFELAKNVDDATELYVGAAKNTNGEIKAGALLGYANEAAQFELTKSEKFTPITNDYVYLNGSRVVNSMKQDTVAYYTYTVKVFDATENWYMDKNGSLTKTEGSAAKVIIKENVDGSVSLIPSTLTDNAKYFSVAASKDKDEAWATTAKYYDLASQLSVSLKTFMVEEDPTLSYEAVPQHVSFEAVRGGFMTKDENNDARLAIANVAAEDLTFWLDTVNSDQNIPSFYIMKNGAFMYNATDSAKIYKDKNNYRFNVENNGDSPAKLIFKAGELVTSDTIRTTINGQSVLVAAKDNAPKNIKGGLDKFQYQIIRAEAGSDEYVIRQGAQYVCLYNNYFYMDSKKDEAYRFVIEKQAAPTANEGIEVSEVKVIAGNGQITIMGAAGKKVVVSNILGKVVASQTISSDNATIAVPAGIVAVAVEGEAAVKAVVK